MMPAASSRRTRSRHGLAVKPTILASFCMVERPSRCSETRILTSMRSNAGGRLTAMETWLRMRAECSRSKPMCGYDFREGQGTADLGCFDKARPQQRHRNIGEIEIEQNAR